LRRRAPLAAGAIAALTLTALSCPSSPEATAAEPVPPAAMLPAAPRISELAALRAERATATRGHMRAPLAAPAAIAKPARAAKPAARKARPAAKPKRVVHRATVRKTQAKRVERAQSARKRTVAHRARKAAPKLSRRATGGAAAIVEAARGKIGQPYSYGRLDCSGLTKLAYARVGISLPHKASKQDEYGRRVSRSSARPGDLVFWGGDAAHHVAVYIGGGRVIHAPGRGRHVQRSRLWGSPMFVRVLR
jgi:cell wall-associated NlpC family hydrolase